VEGPQWVPAKLGLAPGSLNDDLKSTYSTFVSLMLVKHACREHSVVAV